MFDIRSGHPLISRLVFYFSLLLLFYFRISLIGNVFSVLFLLWLFIACHIYLLPSTAPGISVLQGILKFPVRSLALGNAILWATFFLHLFLRFRFVFQVMVFLYSHSFPWIPCLHLDFLALFFSLTNIARLFGMITVMFLHFVCPIYPGVCFLYADLKSVVWYFLGPKFVLLAA